MKVAATLALLWLALALPAKACGLALVLAVDVSGSIDPAEYHFQMRGMADALEDPTIVDSLVLQQAALTVIQWSGAGEQKVSIPWQRMLSPEAVARFATTVRQTDRKWAMSKTAIGDLIAFATQSFQQVSDCRRMVIDISGDGMANDGRAPRQARRHAKGQAITINGLAIDRVGLSVTTYYRREIIAGRDAFVETATGYSDYPRAIRRKLLREVVVPAS